MHWLIPIGTAVWAMWTWATEREEERRRERARLTALYVNPFVSACEDLQSRIYHIVALDGLRHLRQRYPDGAYAEETLYLVVRFFGWLATILRYGPYTQDAEVIRLAEAVRDAFGSSDLPIGPFTFFRAEQKALGKIVMERFEGQHGVELDTIPFYDFRDLLESGALAQSASLRDSIAALRDAEEAADLPGRARLAAAQSHLVDLLRYLEAREDFHLFVGTRERCLDVPAAATTTAPAALPSPDPVHPEPAPAH